VVPLIHPLAATTWSFEEIYKEHFPFVWRSLRRLGVAERDAADLSQEVFLVLHRRLGEFQGKAKITTWLFRVCLHMSQGYRRQLASRREDLDEAALGHLTDPTDDPEVAWGRRDGLQLLESALSSMTLELRTVFVLFELEGQPTPEIAEVLELPLGTVYSRLRRSREVFEQALKRQVRRPLALVARENP
jgi:RNA polymerase sigma-70 factor, ECF subfamily